jgi:hypothetical protein
MERHIEGIVADSRLRVGLCRETQSREIMAVLVNQVVADALRLGLYDKPAERVVKAHEAPLRRTGTK